MFKKTLAIVCGLLLVSVLAVVVVPVLGADAPGSTQPPATQGIGRIGKAVFLVRLLLVKDEAKVDALLAKAEANGKLTEDQVAKLKEFWAAHHEQFTKRVVVHRLLRVQDEAKLKAFLSQAVSNNKISQAQADKIIAVWEKMHNK